MSTLISLEGYRGGPPQQFRDFMNRRHCGDIVEQHYHEGSADKLA